MASQIEILLKAKNDTDAAFKAVIKHLDATSQEAKKTNQILGGLADDLKGKLGGAASDLTGKLGPLGSSLSALGPFGIAAAAAVGALVGALGAAIRISVDAASAAAKYGDNLSALADRTGLSTDALQKFEVAAKLGNSTLDAVAAAVNKMQIAMVGGSKAFGQLGLDINVLKSMEPDKAFVAVAQAIESINDPAERAAARVAIFGKAGNELAGTLKAAAQGAGELGGALSGEALSASAALQDRADLLATAWERVELQFGAAIAQSPELQRALDDLIDFVSDLASQIAKATPQIVAMFDAIVLGARKAVAAAELLAKIQFSPIDAIRQFKSDLEQIDLDAMFSDVSAAATSTGIKMEGSFKGATKAAKDTSKAVKEVKEALEAAGPPASQIVQYFGEIPILTSALGTIGNDFLNGLRTGEVMITSLVDTTEEATEKTIDWSDTLRDLEAGFQLLGGTAGETLAQIAGGIANVMNSIKLIKDAGSGISGVLGQLAGGLGIAGTVIGIGKGIFDAIFGGAKKAREEMEKLRAEFLKSQGGMAALQAKAKEAGIALDRMFNAKNAQQLSSAIAQIKDQLDTWEQAQQDLADAMERYGLTVDQMGPRFAQQQLDQQAAALIKDFALLTQAGADVVVVTQAMADEMNAYVQSVIKSGSTIPESMRPMLQRMLDMGLLTNEGGEAFKSFEEAGITFSQSMSEQFSNLMVQIQKLVEALARGFHVPVSFDFTSTGNPPEPVPPGGNPHFPEGAGGFVGTFPNSGGMAMLHGQEAVVPLSDPAAMRALGEAIASAMHASGGGGSAVPVIHNIIELDGRALDTRTSRRMRQRGIRLPDQQRGRM